MVINGPYIDFFLVLVDFIGFLFCNCDSDANHCSTSDKN